jgi:hypothetical protein
MTEHHTPSDKQPERQQTGTFDFQQDNPPGLIAERLSHPADLDRLVRDFDAGETEVRDVGRFTLNGRRAAMNAGRAIFNQGRDINQVLGNNREALNSMNQANEHLRYVMTGDAPYAQPSAGWNFAVNASGFRDAGYSWAKQLDASLASMLQAATGDASQGGIDALLKMGARADTQMRQIWDEFIKHDPLSSAWYLAERSLVSENFQAERFEKEMVQAKNAAARQINAMAHEYNLPTEHQNRALLQLYRAKFSAFDHMIGGVDAGDGTLGDYLSNSLRVETKLGGNVANPRDPSDVLGTTTHELFHATSAQEEGRIGLKVDGQGTDINEGMTELLNKLSLDRVRQIDNEVVFIDYQDGRAYRSSTYDTEVKSMYMIKMRHSDTFKTLFNAYYGHVSDKAKLRDAIDLFNQYAGQIASIKSGR